MRVLIVVCLALCVPSGHADYENKLIIDLAPPARPRFKARDDGMLQEVKDLVLRVEHTFNDRFRVLSDRISKVEERQESMAAFNDPGMIDWRPLGTNGKKIRVFSSPSSWHAAKDSCQHHKGKLLIVDSENENKKITDYLQNFDQNLYWISAQSRVSFNLPDGRYHNFDSTQMSRDCVAMSTVGTWLHLDCAEKHGYVCQF